MGAARARLPGPTHRAGDGHPAPPVAAPAHPQHVSRLIEIVIVRPAPAWSDPTLPPVRPYRYTGQRTPKPSTPGGRQRRSRLPNQTVANCPSTTRVFALTARTSRCWWAATRATNSNPGPANRQTRTRYGASRFGYCSCSFTTSLRFRARSSGALRLAPAVEWARPVEDVQL